MVGMSVFQYYCSAIYKITMVVMIVVTPLEKVVYVQVVANCLVDTI